MRAIYALWRHEAPSSRQDEQFSGVQDRLRALLAFIGLLAAVNHDAEVAAMIGACP